MPAQGITESVAAHSDQAQIASGGITPFFPDWVVSLQPDGTGRPVFVFPPAHDARAALAIEARLAGHVGRVHPFWGFGCDAACVERVRVGEVASLAAEYVTQMRSIQGNGPFLLYGNCFGGYLAWETARQLLDAGEQIGGILFFEVPLRADFTEVLPGHAPAHSQNLLRFSHYYRVQALPVDVTHVMTAGWHASGWWATWRQVALGSAETVIVPGETERAFDRREERIARHVREWIETAEARIRGA